MQLDLFNNTEMEAREAAKGMIAPYVKRGDDLESIKYGQMGCGCDRFTAFVGGYVNGKRISTDHIVVTIFNGQKINAIFKLKELYEEIKHNSSTEKNNP